MAKKKTVKKPVTKRTRTTRATIEQRNESLAPKKPRAPRKPKVTVTTEPAIVTVTQSNDGYSTAEKELLDAGWKHDLTTDDFVFYPDTEKQCCGGCNPNLPWWRKADMKMEQFKNWFRGKVEKTMHWAFDHPLAFTISLLSFFIGVAVLVLLSSRK